MTIGFYKSDEYPHRKISVVAELGKVDFVGHSINKYVEKPRFAKAALEAKESAV